MIITSEGNHFSLETPEPAAEAEDEGTHGMASSVSEARG